LVAARTEKVAINSNELLLIGEILKLKLIASLLF